MDGYVETRTETASGRLSAAAACSSSNIVHTLVETVGPKYARVVTTHARRFVIGEALRLDLAGPDNEGLRMLGVVLAASHTPGSIVQRLELELLGLTPDDRHRLIRLGRAAPFRARITEKIDVVRTADRLSVKLVGSLNSREARILCELVESALDGPARRSSDSRPLVVCIDVSRFSACPEHALGWMRRSLEQLTSKGPMLGVIVGPSSVGMMQFQRLVRAVGVAEHLMVYRELAEAEEILDAMVCELFGENQ